MTPEQVLRTYYENANEINAITARRQPTFEEKVMLAKMVGTYLKQNMMGRQPEGAWFKNRGFGIPGENPERKREEAIYAEPKYNWSMGEVDAFHGSPHKFEKFTNKAIGSGEGHQAFGWGLYFSDEKSIAEAYGSAGLLHDKAVKVGDKVFKTIGQTPNGATHVDVAVDALVRFKGDKKEALDWLGDFGMDLDARNWINKNITGEMAELVEARNLYKVKLHPGRKDEVWLDWDKPVDGDFLNKLIKQASAEDIQLGRYEGIVKSGRVKEYQEKGWIGRGQNIYEELADKLGSEQEASKFLSRAGIDGIRYPSGSLSGVKNSKHNNYVVFDENSVLIEEATQF